MRCRVSHIRSSAPSSDVGFSTIACPSQCLADGGRSAAATAESNSSSISMIAKWLAPRRCPARKSCTSARLLRVRCVRWSFLCGSRRTVPAYTRRESRLPACSRTRESARNTSRSRPRRSQPSPPVRTLARPGPEISGTPTPSPARSVDEHPTTADIITVSSKVIRVLMHFTQAIMANTQLAKPLPRSGQV